ncbi:uncharacterized protein LOC126656097 isoform X2 [Mercurialis annua]|uniref:uncharacterized protein LOC126656097 isoform X2 n=1 Tax=Mercurialis annua TaxID=3986 RepID=UPI0021602267|nr:uncharacterized protein LOC126656097 isoform X2 [Mercurialis annua]
MASNPVIFDISSDEEATSFDEMRSSSGGCGDDDDDHDWLTQLLENFDRERADSSSSCDDVVVIGEYIPANKNIKEKPSKLVKHFDDDDDCVILECDPEKSVDVVDNCDDDGDDILVVGQKGQIACRDYPHPRHLCAKYPFSSTPHEKYCELCHCYVCDSLAPCALWVAGVSTIDHCHATDKQEMWKRLRESSRLGKKSPLPVPKCPDAHLPVTLPLLNQLPPEKIIRAAAITRTHNMVSRRDTIRSCSSARFSVPNIISQTRNQRPVYAQGRNGFLPGFPQHSAGIGMHNNTLAQDRGPHVVFSKTTFKKPGIIRQAAVVNQSVCGSLINRNSAPPSHCLMSSAPQTTANAKSTSGWHGVIPPNNISESYSSQSPPQPNKDDVSVSTMLPLAQSYSQPVPQSNDSGNVFQYGNQSQNVVDSGFSDFDLGWLYNSSKITQQSLVENIHYNGTSSNNGSTTIDHLCSDFTGSTEHHPKDHVVDHDYHNWLLAQSDALASEGVPDLNAFSPECSAFDAAIFD